jgi:hypothetical protein
MCVVREQQSALFNKIISLVAGELEETLSVRPGLRAANDNVTSTAIYLWCSGGQWVFLT